MWDGRKLLFAGIIFTALYYRVAAEEPKPLDMARGAVDDQYKGCHKEAMETFILSGLLQQELNRSEEFQKAWSENGPCLEQNPQRTEDVAVLTYLAANEYTVQKFNDAVARDGADIGTYKNFPFKSLHFLLMEYITKHKSSECKTMYFVSKKAYTAKKGSEVRLGGFNAAAPNFKDINDVEFLDEDVIFNVTSCFFVKLRDIICQTESDNRLLLAPVEVFTVESVQKHMVGDSKPTVIVLKHSTVKSFHNCYMFSRSPAEVCSQWLVLVLVASTLFVLNNV